MRITLDWHLVQRASNVGCLRNLTAMRSGRQHVGGLDSTGWSEHIEGALGECAVAQALGLHWDQGINTFKTRPDVAGLQVRTRSRHSYDLLLRPGDSQRDAWVHVTGTCPEYWIRGWLWGYEALRSKYLRKDIARRPPAYFIPTADLRAIEDLPRDLLGWARAG
jgi:hypothetical protein